MEKAHIALAALYVTYIWGLSKAQLEYTYYYAWRDMTASQIARETGKTFGAISKTLKKARAHTRVSHALRRYSLVNPGWGVSVGVGGYNTLLN